MTMHLLHASWIMLIMSAVSGNPFEYEVLSLWEVKRTSDDITFSYRDVRVGDTLTTKEMRMQFSIAGLPDVILPYFRDPELFMSWSPDVDACELVESDGSSWTLYKYYNMPWPLSERDIVTKYELRNSDTLMHMTIIGVPLAYPEQDDVQRIKDYEAQWFIRPVGEGICQVEFRTAQLGKPVGPRAIQDRIIENSFVKSVNQLKDLIDKNQ